MTFTSLHEINIFCFKKTYIIKNCFQKQSFNWDMEFNSVQFSHSVMSDSAAPRSATRQSSLTITKTGTYSNSYPLSQGCHPTISSSVVPFSSFPQSFPASRSFQVSQSYASGGQNIGVSASASVLPMNTQY